MIPQMKMDYIYLLISLIENMIGLEKEPQNEESAKLGESLALYNYQKKQITVSISNILQ